MSKISEADLDRVKARFKRSSARTSLKPAYEMRKLHQRPNRGSWKCGVDESVWQKRTSPWGVETARIKVDLWEVHVMRIVTFREEYYVGVAINGDDIKRATYTCKRGTLLPKILNTMFGLHRKGVLFVMRDHRTRSTRSDKGKWRK